jgi:peroxiredoxin Q/BCP
MKRVLWALVLSMLCGFSAYAAPVPQEGAQAPGFTLPDQAGESISLRQLHGTWVVLYFYPKDFTSGCTLEAHNFQLSQPEFAQRNAVILGVSFDSVVSHKGFCAKEGLNFKLLSDTAGRVSALYGSTMQHNGTTLSARNTFLIDPSGVIRKVYIHVDPAGHSKELLAALDILAKK